MKRRYKTSFKLFNFFISKRSIFLFLFSSLLYSDDFSNGLKNYENGNYLIAQIFFEKFIKENPNDTLFPKATYYLLKIYGMKDEYVKLFSLANQYLEWSGFDSEREEIFNLLVQKLVDKNSYTLAFNYLKKYDYIPVDTGLIDKIVLNLATQGFPVDELLNFSPGNESLLVLKTKSLNDINERIKILKKINGIKGRLYLIENYLLMEDTLTAYELFKNVKATEVPKDMLYRWAILGLNFKLNEVKEIIQLMEKHPELKDKVKILKIFNERRLSGDLPIANTDDIELIKIFLNTTYIDSNDYYPPEDIKMGSILQDTVDIENRIASLRENYKRNFYLDSIYSELLIKKEKFNEAYIVIKDYLKYPETKNYARIVRALKDYKEKNYHSALKDLKLSSFDNQYIKFVYAECLQNTGRDPTLLYEELIKNARDPVIRHKSFANYVNYKFLHNDYYDITKFKQKEFTSDTNLARYYFLSLIHTGKKSSAESGYINFFGRLDKNFYLNVIEDLIENKLLKKAQNLIDSIIEIYEYLNDEDLFYYACLIPFQRGNYALAENRFATFINKFKDGKYYFQALFKMGTLKYLNQEFDSSAFYYGLCSGDTSIRIDALKNQLIALKKAEDWDRLVEVGESLIGICPDSAKAEVSFDIGYAYLRKGNIKSAIENLKTASKLKSYADYYYWLGEAYLGKGDFIRALYEYQKIVNYFKKDEMWYPTALFKMGLSLEMMDEKEGAVKIYSQIIKERGLVDVWGAEAKKRLEQMK